MKDLKLFTLRLIKENGPVGLHKFDRLFYEVQDYKNRWDVLTEELKEEGLITFEKYFAITPKGERYLEENQ